MKSRRSIRKVVGCRFLAITSFSLISLTLLSSFFLLNTDLSASANVNNTITVSIQSSCTISTGGGNYSQSITPGSTETITATTVTIACNDTSGYALYAIGFSGDSYTGTNTDLISSDNTNYNIKTNASGTYGSSWKMKLTAGANATITSGYTDFHNIPSTYDKVASYSTNTASSTLTPTYQINTTSSQPAGTYNGKVKYTLVHPSSESAPGFEYSLNYNANSGTGAPAAQSGFTNGNSYTFTISSTEPTRSGYTFLGWSTSSSALTADYDPGDTFTANSPESTLYAVWEEQ